MGEPGGPELATKVFGREGDVVSLGKGRGSCG